MFQLFQPVAQRRLEAFFVLVAALFMYKHTGHSWGIFAALFFIPDLALLAYVAAGPRVGGLCYNLSHSFIFPVVMGLYAYVASDTLFQQLALIWLSHCAFDRALGWGLKYSDSFCNTDMGVKTLPIENKYLA